MRKWIRDYFLEKMSKFSAIKYFMWQANETSCNALDDMYLKFLNRIQSSKYVTFPQINALWCLSAALKKFFICLVEGAPKYRNLLE